MVAAPKGASPWTEKRQRSRLLHKCIHIFQRRIYSRERAWLRHERKPFLPGICTSLEEADLSEYSSKIPQRDTSQTLSVIPRRQNPVCGSLPPGNTYKKTHSRVDWTISEHPENSGMHVHLPIRPVTCLLHDIPRIQNLLERDWSSPASHTSHRWLPALGFT